MAINYRDHLTLACDDKIISQLCVTNPRIIGLSKSINYTFELRHDLEMLEKQCDVFISEFRKNSKFVNHLDKCISLRWDLRDQYTRKSYKYSYFKAICIIKSVFESGINSLSMIPMNSYLFHGHLKLVHTFLQYNISNYHCNLESNLTLSKILQYNVDTYFKVIQEDDDFKQWYNEFYPNNIFNPEIERILDAMKDIEGINVNLASSINATFGNQPKKEPLGNMCFRSFENGVFKKNNFDILTVTTRESLTDHVSKFWNLANCIYLVKEDESIGVEFSSSYDSIRFDALSNACYFAMVESITGMTSGTMYSNYGKSNPYTPEKDDKKGPGKPPSGDRPKKTQPKTPPPKPSSDPETPRILDAAKGIYKSIRKYGGNPIVREVVSDAGYYITNRQLERDKINYLTKKIEAMKLSQDKQEFKSGVPLLEHKTTKQTTTIERTDEE